MPHGRNESNVAPAAVTPLGDAARFVRTGSFHLHRATAGRDEIVLEGELDADCEDLFALALERARPGRSGEPIVVHGERLRFIDHRNLLVLERYADQSGATVVLRTPCATARRLVDLLDLKHVRAEAIA
jgi:hypothetical protein